MLKRFLAIALLCCSLASCGWPNSALSSNTELPSNAELASNTDPSDTDNAELATATFAGGCFWCMEGPFDQLQGVISTTSGYSGGDSENPTYGQVSAGITGHAESVQVVYDPQQVDYATLLQTFWHNIDPLDRQGQFCDKGSQYRSVIFYNNEAERQQAESSKLKVAQQLSQSQKLGQKDAPETAIATTIVPSSTFYPAEDYHQDYYIKNPVRYKIYRTGCGRDRRLSQLWGDAAGH